MLCRCLMNYLRASGLGWTELAPEGLRKLQSPGCWPGSGSHLCAGHLGLAPPVVLHPRGRSPRLSRGAAEPLEGDAQKSHRTTSSRAFPSKQVRRPISVQWGEAINPLHVLIDGAAGHIAERLSLGWRSFSHFFFFFFVFCNLSYPRKKCPHL